MGINGIMVIRDEMGDAGAMISDLAVRRLHSVIKKR